MPNAQVPTLSVSSGANGAQPTSCVIASGTWQVNALAQDGAMKTIALLLHPLAGKAGVAWDLTRIDSMDYIGAQIFWNAWGKAWPANVQLSPLQQEFFKRLEKIGPLALPQSTQTSLKSVRLLGAAILDFFAHVISFVALVGQVTQDVGRFLRHPMRGPWREISANIYHAGFRALGITALVGFLIGVVLSYLSAQQLRAFGGDIYLVNLLGMSIIRELGPLLAAILVAGRSGSSITAQLGVMRVTEELDAMLVMGISHGFRLIMPKVLALAVAMPLLVIWTDAMALIGGMVSANIELGLSPDYFLQKLPDAVPLANYMIGLGKGVVFGILIALVACHFGLRIKPNTESLGHGTTTSVVTAITVVILADAVFAIVFREVGF
ncbi:MAG: phospholipid/cholesterol/gamma-HCH transport system permease protein [Janthinobacterium sp.]|jgi:phospholipid/cholesterol/gamma-HCH transport system permease protein